MNKKIKRLISSLLASAMLVGSIIPAVLADDVDNPQGEDLEEINAVVPTEVPLETPLETPAAQINKYENDTYYQKALSLCSGLGIITGYEDGSVKPESDVTRAEMAAIVLRILKTESMLSYNGIFADVSSSHWAADTIQTAYQKTIVNGVGNGNFEPDGNVLYEQVVKMLVCALNYDLDAKNDGGYPSGYMNVARTLKLLQGAQGVIGQKADRGTVIKMVYNALMADYREMTGTKNGYPEYTVNGTLAETLFDVKEGKGIVTTTAKTTIDTSAKPEEGKIYIDGDEYYTNLKNYEDFLAKYVTYYYINDKKNGDTLISITVNDNKTSTVKLDADDIKSVSGFSDNAGRVVSKDKSKIYRADNASVLYNGEVLTEAKYLKAKNDAKDKSMFKSSYDEFLTPSIGSIELIDYNSDDVYDVVNVESYETLLVSAANDKRVTGEINAEAVSINVDTTDVDRKITVIRAGSEAKVRNLKKDDVVSLKRNIDDTVLSFTCTGENITGKVSSLSNEDDKTYAKINGTSYEVDANAMSSVKSGTEGTFYLDMFGRIGYVGNSSGGLLSGGEKYAWIVNTFSDNGGDYLIVKLYTQDGKAEEYNLASKVTVSGPGIETKQYTSSEAIDQLNNKIEYATAAGMGVPFKLCKFKTNTNNEITRISVAKAIEKGSTHDDTDLNFVNTNLRNSAYVAGLVNGYKFEDGMIEFTVPNNVEDMKKGDSYSVATTNASNYQVREDGLAIDVFAAEFKDEKTATPTVMVKFAASATAAASLIDYSTTANNPCIMVEKIVVEYNSDDEPVYKITGYNAGGKVSYTTKTTSALGRLNSTVEGNTKENYSSDATLWWNGVDGIKAPALTAKPDAKSFDDLISKGDIVGIGNNGGIMVKMVDIEQLIDTFYAKSGATTQFMSLYNKYSARDILNIGMLQDVEENDGYIIVNNESYQLDASRQIDKVIVTLDSQDNIKDVEIEKETSTIYDLTPYDATTGEGDFAFVRLANKGELQDLHIIEIAR